MKKDVHPEYAETTISCGCGNVIATRSTAKDIKVEVCSACHSFYTGQQKFIDAAGRVEKFQQKYGKMAIPPSNKKKNNSEIPAKKTT